MVTALEQQALYLQKKAARDLALVRFSRENWAPKITRTELKNEELDRERKKLQVACRVASNQLEIAEGRVKELETLVQVKRKEWEFQKNKVVADGCPAQSAICPEGTEHALTYCVKRGQDVDTACNARLAGPTTRDGLRRTGLVEPDIKLTDLSLLLTKAELREEERKRAKEEGEADA